MTVTLRCYRSYSIKLRLNIVRLLPSCLHGHTCLANQFTVTLTQLSCAQGMILRVSTVTYCCEDAMGIQMSVAWQSMQWIPHVILCQWGKNIGICCGLYGALDTLEGRHNTAPSGAWTSRWWNEQWGATRARGARPHCTLCKTALSLQVWSKSGRWYPSYYLRNHIWSDDAPPLIGPGAACIIHG